MENIRNTEWFSVYRGYIEQGKLQLAKENMGKKYIDFVCKALSEYEIGKPIYLHRISECMAKEYVVPYENAADEVAVAYKRIMETGLVPELRVYQSEINSLRWIS